MEISMKKNRLSTLTFFFVLVLLTSIGSGFSYPAFKLISCQPPDVSVSSKSAGTISFSWGGVAGGKAYDVYFYRHEDHYTSGIITTSSTSVLFSSLPSGTYDFYFATECDEGPSSFIIIEDILM
jgi:hypothetical protein